MPLEIPFCKTNAGESFNRPLRDLYLFRRLPGIPVFRRAKAARQNTSIPGYFHISLAGGYRNHTVKGANLGGPNHAGTTR